MMHAQGSGRRPGPGDLVEVRSAREIAATLDGDGTLEALPFMPEMIEHCGKRYRVRRRVVKTCFSGKDSTMREFPNDDVVLLEGLRCSGADHDGCQKACMLFWKDAWLRPVEEQTTAPAEAPGESEQLRARLKTTTGPNLYFCQASELLKATTNLSRPQRFLKCSSEIRARNCSVVEMAKRVSIWIAWKARRLVLGELARGAQGKTPDDSLNLQPGELVEVKSLAEIRQTVNERGRNRGLHFSPDMRLFCGRRYRVKGRLEKMIFDGSGEMRRLRNTVFLEDAFCGCPYSAFGGCVRCEYVYWREIWLKRVE